MIKSSQVTFVIIAVIAIVAGLLRLGFWQLARAEQKEAQFALIQERQKEVVHLNSVSLESGWEDLLYMLVTAKGSYDATHHIIYDNVTYQGVAGVAIFTPFQLANRSQAILVNRGWQPLKDRRKITQLLLQVATTEMMITGNLSKPASRMTLSKMPEGTGFPLLVQSLDTKRLAAQLGYSVLPFIVQLDAKEPYGYARDWQPISGSAEKHRAYAVQWFGFALIFLVGTLLVYHKNKRRIAD